MRRVILLVCVIPLVMAMDCANEANMQAEEFGDPKPIEVIMRNSDALPVHIFQDAGEFFPCCQVAPQGSRRTGGQMMTRQSAPEFRAGRNGEILFTRTCKLTQVGYDAEVVSVVFTGSGLSCSGW